MPKKILVVDDEKIVCDMARIILQNEGYEVDTFTDSQSWPWTPSEIGVMIWWSPI